MEKRITKGQMLINLLHNSGLSICESYSRLSILEKQKWNKVGSLIQFIDDDKDDSEDKIDDTPDDDIAIITQIRIGIPSQKYGPLIFWLPIGFSILTVPINTGWYYWNQADMLSASHESDAEAFTELQALVESVQTTVDFDQMLMDRIRRFLSRVSNLPKQPPTK